MIPRFAILLLFIHHSLFSFCQYEPGFYIDSAGNRVDGLLKYTYGGSIFTSKAKGDCRCLYKSDSARKAVKFTAMDIRGFVIGQDSFTVIRNYRLNSFVTYPVDFCHVIETGPIVLLQYDAIVAGGNMSSYTESSWILKKNRKIYPLTRGNYKEIMEDLMNEDSKLVEKIKNKELKFKNTPEIVHKYNMYLQKTGT
jgi:hypothetical protein